jgi:hypothetical protein
MLIKSGVVASGSGSMGGITLSHNKGGMYFRTRAIPTNPGTTYQQVIRNIIAALASRWSETLTPTQRAAWQTYADNVPLLNPLGDPINVSGLNMFTRCNVARQQAGVAGVDDAPTVFNLGEFTDPVITADAVGDQASIAFTNTDDWANEDGAYMLSYASRPQNRSINYFKGPYRYMDSIAGNSTTPPTSPAAQDLPFALAYDQNVFFRVIVVRADGRVSADFRSFSWDTSPT